MTQKPCEHHISNKPVKGMSPNFGHKCIWFIEVLIRFWGQKVKDLGTVGNDLKYRVNTTYS